MQVPEGWVVKKLSEIASIKHGFAFESQYFFNEEKDCILLTPGNFHIEKRLYFGSNTKFYDGPVPEEYILNNGDLLVVMTDLTKDMAILGNAVLLSSNKTVLHNQRIGLVSTETSEVNKKFLCFLLNSNLVRNEIKTSASGTTVRHTSPSKILSVSVILPDLKEQQKIAQILSTWDKAITTTEQLLANSQQQKKALMQQLLTGKKRLLDENGQRFSGKWERAELGELLNYVQPAKYLVSNTDYSDEYETPVLTAGKTFILGYTDEKEGVFHSECPVIIFDDFTTSSQFVDFSFKVKSSALKILTPKKGANIKYVFEAMQMIQFAIGGHQRHWISIFSFLVIPLPSFEEQQKIAAVLSTADQKIATLKQKLEHLKQEKKALMQQLLTGKRRVTV